MNKEQRTIAALKKHKAIKDAAIRYRKIWMKVIRENNSKKE